MDTKKHDAWRELRVCSPDPSIGPAALPSIDSSVEKRLGMSSTVFVHIVDDDSAVRDSLGDLLRSLDYEVALYGSAADFLKVELPDAPACLVLDVRLPGTSGLELQEHLASINVRLPVILMTGFGDIPMTVRGMKLGAVDFLTKPIRDQDLLDAVANAIRRDQDRRQDVAQTAELREKYSLLTARERQVMALVASGLMNKQVASRLSISEVTVKMHRGSVMRKLEAKSVAMLARMAEALDIAM
jgi:FixJ family two-component response regulator